MGNEKELVNGLRSLNPQAISIIHEEFFPVIFKYTSYRLGDLSLAEDITSEVFIRLLEAAHAGRLPRASLRGWLVGTASNLVNDYFRKIYSQPSELLQEDAPAQNGDPASHAEQADRREALRSALVRLTPEQQHVLALRFGSNCSLAETAEIMEKNPNAVKQLQFRALTALRKSIEGKI